MTSVVRFLSAVLLVAMALPAAAQIAPSRTWPELRDAVQDRANRNAYPLTGYNKDIVGDVLSRIDSLDRSRRAAVIWRGRVAACPVLGRSPGTISPAAKEVILNFPSVISAIRLQKNSPPPYRASSDFGKLEARRHLISGVGWAIAGALTVEPTVAVPATLKNLRLLMFPSLT